MSNRVYNNYTLSKVYLIAEANMGNKIIVPFDDKKGGVYELNVDLIKR
uniref:Uncharacterized protein n=1 Tax=Wolbachia endosymbiont of Aleurodicus floccissimus TaxID=2152762 RepID=A0A3B0IXV1_9RICK